MPPPPPPPHPHHHRQEAFYGGASHPVPSCLDMLQLVMLSYHHFCYYNHVFRLATAVSLVQKATDTELVRALWLTLDPK